MNPVGKALLFALIAAIGNAVFVYGQKRSVPGGNPFIFLTCSLSICVLLLTLWMVFFPLPNIKTYLHFNWRSILITGIGLFITYFGFYLLYSRFGASYYIIYAVASIITTSIIVGVVILKETFNFYYVLSFLCAIITIILFFMAQRYTK